MSIDIKDIACKPFGKCVLISNSIVELCVTVDQGPRIIHFGFTGGKNLLFNKNKISIKQISEIENLNTNIKSLDKYTGHRLLLKEYPNKNNIPTIENKPVVYSLLPNGIKFVPAYSNLQTSIEITLNENSNDLMVLHSIKNLSEDKINLAICASTSFPGENNILILPQKEENQDITFNRVLSIWPYSKINDPRLSLFDKYITFSPDPTDKSLFKLGSNNIPGWVSFLNDNVIIFKRFVHNSNAKYLNGESSLEFFSTENILTVDTLSPIFEIEKNETARHVENWSIFETKSSTKLNSEHAIDDFFKSIFI